MGDDSDVPITLSSSYIVVSILVALAQLGFAIATLYRTRGDQTVQYGYAAFGLTVTQYAMMSLLNTLGNLLCPQYSAVYLVRSHGMTDAESDPSGIGLFEGVVGTLLEDDIQVKEAERRHRLTSLRKGGVYYMRVVGRRSFQLPLLWLPAAVSIAITYWLSRFEKGSSTSGQRLATMGWLASGSYIGALAGEEMGPDGPNRNIYLAYLFPTFIHMVGSVPSITGFIVVAQELKQCGSCSRV